VRNIKDCYKKEGEWSTWLKEHASFYVGQREVTVGIMNDNEIRCFREYSAVRFRSCNRNQIKRIKPTKSQF